MKRKNKNQNQNQNQKQKNQKRKKLFAEFAPLAAVVVLAAVLVTGLWRDPAPAVPTPPKLVDNMLPDFNLADLHDPEKFHNDSVFEGKIALVNVFATWCGPCEREHPYLVKLAETQRIPIYGVNFQDQRENAIGWLSEKGNPYRVVMSDPDGRAAVSWGIYAVPETLLIDEKGVIHYRLKSVLTEEIWQQKILPLVESLEKGSS